VLREKNENKVPKKSTIYDMAMTVMASRVMEEGLCMRRTNLSKGNREASNV